MHTFFGHFNLDIDFWPHFLEHISYITANFPQICLMLDQFLLGHLSLVCDISCFLIDAHFLIIDIEPFHEIFVFLCQSP